MSDIAAVLNASSIVTNIIAIGAGTNPAQFGAVAIPDGTDVGIGYSYSNGVFTPPPPTPVDPAVLANDVRTERDRLLYQCDWTMLPDAPPEVVKADWEVYRQALRDVTNQPGFPENVVWPTAPFVIGPV